MSIREPAQPLTRTSRLPYEAISFTEKSVGPAVDTVPSVRKQPELLVSHPALTLVQRAADKPVFSVLAIAQQHADTPVTLSTDEPDYFQLASDSRPAFGSTLTFVPPPTGAYVHVRYMAPKGCSHQAHLTIEAPYTSTTVALEGRTTGALSVVRNILPSTNRVSAKQPNRVISSSRWAALWATVLVSGLAYAGYIYQCQLFPSLCQEKTTESVQPKSHFPLPQPVTDDLSARTANKKIVPKRKFDDKVPATRSSSGQTSVAFTDNPVEKLPNNQSDEPRRIARNRTSTTVTEKESTEPKVRSQIRRQQDTTPTEKESDLERELNKHL